MDTILANNLSKQYGHKKVVDGLNISVKKGKIFGLLGPNGAGKTTTIRMLCGVIENDTGEALINNKPVQQAKSQFGYVAQHFGQYEELSVWENIEFYANMYDVFDKDWLKTLMVRYGLAPFEKHLAGSLSGGFQRRLALICALTHNPQVLFLDEPTAGIDPVTRKLLWDDFYQLSAEGKTLFVTTHYMEEAQRCHQLAFISNGKIVAEGSPNSIKNALNDSQVFSTLLPFYPNLKEHLLKDKNIILVNQFGDELRIITTPKIDQKKITKSINGFTKKDCKLSISQANLEDVFIALTQNQND